MSRLEVMRRFELPGIEYDREPPETGRCSECFADVPADKLVRGLWPEVSGKSLDIFRGSAAEPEQGRACIHQRQSGGRGLSRHRWKIRRITHE